MKRIALTIAATVAFLLPASSAAATPHVHTLLHASHSNIDWD